jgi:hypothetical protein
MSVINNFDIATDLKVEMLLAEGARNVFVLGISTLGGTNVLGDDTSGNVTWQDLACEVNAVNTSIGGSIGSNVFFQADSGKAQINMQSWTFDPNNYPFIRPGVEVRVKAKRGGYEFILWHGTLDDITVTYAPDQPNQITVNATDFWALLVNRRFDFEPTVPLLPSEAIQLAIDEVAATGFVIPYDSFSINPEWYMTGTPQMNTTFGQVAANCLTTGLGFIAINPNTGYLEYRPRATTGGYVYTIGNNHGEANHLCMADLDSEMRSDQVFNSTLVTQKYEYLGDPIFTQLYTDQDSIDLFGQRSEDFTVDLATVADADAWAQAVFMPKPITVVTSVTTPAIDRSRNLTEAIEFMPGDTVRVLYSNDDIDIDTVYTVTRVRHIIDVNNWFTTLEVWKEF